MSFIKKEYNTEKYNFQDLVKQIFNVSNLHNLHNERKDLFPDYKLEFSNESKTGYHNLFYGYLNNHEIGKLLKKSYKEFIKNEIAEQFGEDIVYQKFPTVRFHLPHDKAIHYWHYDSDPDHMHPDWEINFQIALTDMYDTQAMWIETVPGLKDFSPIEMKYGEYSIFNGNKCEHGNKTNTTELTRVSFDFRIIPFSRYEQTKNLSATKGCKFIIGEYYEVFISKGLE